MTGDELIAIYEEYLEADLRYNNARVHWQQQACWARGKMEWEIIEQLKADTKPLYSEYSSARKKWDQALKDIEKQWRDAKRQAYYDRMEKEKNDKG